MNEFYKNGYMIVKGLLPIEDVKNISKHLKEREAVGSGSRNDEQVEDSIAFYSDNFLLGYQYEVLKSIEKITGLDLFKTYNYARIYKKGNILRVHTDREACEISVTIDLGGDPWSIWVLDRDENPIEIKLEPGDGVIYRGCTTNHWRAKFDGDEHVQVFMHYVDKHGPYRWCKDDVDKVKPNDIL